MQVSRDRPLGTFMPTNRQIALGVGIGASSLAYAFMPQRILNACQTYIKVKVSDISQQATRYIVSGGIGLLAGAVAGFVANHTLPFRTPALLPRVPAEKSHCLGHFCQKRQVQVVWEISKLFLELRNNLENFRDILGSDFDIILTDEEVTDMFNDFQFLYSTKIVKGKSDRWACCNSSIPDKLNSHEPVDETFEEKLLTELSLDLRNNLEHLDEILEDNLDIILTSETIKEIYSDILCIYVEKIVENEKNHKLQHRVMCINEKK